MFCNVIKTLIIQIVFKIDQRGMTIYGQHANISNFILWGHFKGMTIACSFCGWTRRFDQSEDRDRFKQPILLLKKDNSRYHERLLWYFYQKRGPREGVGYWIIKCP